MVNEGILFGMGNALLDIMTTVKPDFLEKYGLRPNDAILADEEKHKELFHDMIDNHTPITYLPGGATQNAIKVAQWLLPTRHATTYFGCIAKDKFGEILEQKCDELSVNAVYQYSKTAGTGTSAVLINGTTHENRSMVANLAAANGFTREHLDEPAHFKLVESARYFYIAGFFLTACPQAAFEIGDHVVAACQKSGTKTVGDGKGKLLATNLSAPFIPQFFTEPLLKMIEYSDILFGNETEAAAFGEAIKAGTTDLKEIALKAAALPKRFTERPRMVVFTQGKDPVIVVQDGKIKEFAVPAFEQSKIVDTNGAGDAFVGGFLAQLVQDRSLDDCIRCGNYAAQTCLRHQGCSFPEKHDFKQG